MHLFCHGIYYQFQSTVLTGGRDSQSIVSVIAAMFQSTRPRGRTRRESYEKFQPAKLFQSTRPRGRTRPGVIDAPAQPEPVSIHASSREDATADHRMRFRKDWFQSTRPRGRTRRCLPPEFYPESKFQSTRPRGRTRPAYALSSQRIYGFNPRVLAGGRDLTNAVLIYRILFQSTRPRGRTRQSDSASDSAEYVSIHAYSREDATSEQCGNKLRIPVSIHASSREDATILLSSNVTICKFQSTRPRGRTRLIAADSGEGKTVSIHAYSREDATTTFKSHLTDTCFNPRVLAGGRDMTGR